MKLVVVGAAGRMGQTLIRAIDATEGVELSAAIEVAGSAHIGRDAGEMAGIGSNGIAISEDALAAFAAADGACRFLRTRPEGSP